MIKIAKLCPFLLKFNDSLIAKTRKNTLGIFLSVALLTSAEAQTFFSPNVKVDINQQKSDVFIKATPEIELKTNYYVISMIVLETDYF